MNHATETRVRPLKVAFPFVSMPVGGAEDLFLSVARHLPPTIEPHFVCLRSLGVLGEEARSSGLRVHLLPVFPTKRINPFGILKLSRWFRDNEISLVHSQTYHDQLFGVSAAKLAGIPSVVHQHKTLTDLKGRKGFIMKQVFRAAEHVISLSSETRSDLIVTLALKADKVSSLPNAVDSSVFFPVDDKSAIRTSLKLDRDEFLIGSIGWLHSTKNHRATIEAMAIVTKGTLLPLKCMIFGEGPDRPMLETLISRHRLDECLILPGRKRPISPWIQALDLFVLPSHWEGQPMAILQALSCRVPILSSRIEGNVALLGERHPGLFNPEDHEGYAHLIEKAATNTGFRSSIIEYQDTLPVPSLKEFTGTLAALYSRLAQR